MIRIVFRNLDESELARDAVMERLMATIDRFPDLKGHKITATLSMENSPTQAGPDLFKVKFLIAGKRYKNILLEKSAPNFYKALADVIEHTLERLNRFGDKQRVVQRTRQRKLQKTLLTEVDAV